jgi:hypothetical protein
MDPHEKPARVWRAAVTVSAKLKQIMALIAAAEITPATKRELLDALSDLERTLQ